MPLVGVGHNGGAVVLCPRCGTERIVTREDWHLSDPDPTLATVCTPPCPACASEGVGVVECFDWHDEVYLNGFMEPNPKGGPPRLIMRPDHEHPEARQMVLIGRLHQALGLNRRSLPDRNPGGYREPVRAPEPEEVRRRFRQRKERGQ